MKYIAVEELQKFPIRLGHYDEEHGDIKFVCGVESVLEYAECIPSADVHEVKHARWHTLADYKYKKIVQCTACDEHLEFSKKIGIPVDLYPYCPLCGAKMDADKKED